MFARRSHPDATQSTSRLEAFTDGVFAIAATLLVLDLTSHTLGEVGSDGQLFQALGGMSELFFNFVLSFGLLCLLWMTHMQQFEYVARVDAAIVWLNNARLLFIVLVPFATGMTTAYSEWIIGRVVMPATIFLAILCGWLQWLWAMRHREVMLPGLSAADAVGIGRGALSATLISFAVIPLAAFVGSFAFLLFFLDPLVTRLFRGQDAPRSSSST